MSERDYYTSSPYAIFCRMSGHSEFMARIEKMFRNNAAPAYAFAGGKQKLETWWPINGDHVESKVDKIIVDEEGLALIKASHSYLDVFKCSEQEDTTIRG